MSPSRQVSCCECFQCLCPNGWERGSCLSPSNGVSRLSRRFRDGVGHPCNADPAARALPNPRALSPVPSPFQVFNPINIKDATQLAKPVFPDSRSQARRIPNFQPCVPAVGFGGGPFVTTGPAWWRPPCRPVQGTEKRGVNTGHSEVENHGNTIGRGWARVWVAATRGTNPTRYLLFRGLALWVLDVSAAVQV